MKKRKFIFDIGNSRIKAAEFHEQHMIRSFILQDDKALQSFLSKYQAPSIISAVINSDWLNELVTNYPPLQLTSETPLPISLDYETKATLGHDRIAGAVGGYTEFPNEDVLVIDMGTCITYDYVDKKGVFHGGAISPGFNMRLKAMHHFTGKLPDITSNLSDITHRLPGKSTKECMLQGAKQGVALEIAGFIERFRKESDNLYVILTGGDAQAFESFIKEPIFVRPELILMGLNRILDYNEAD